MVSTLTSFRSTAAYWSTVLLRFARLVVVVPLVEEIFWRGFLLRYFINEKFDTVPIGTFSWLSFAVVTSGFAFIHNRADWPAAVITGALYNLVAYRTRSLASCVLAHAVTNLLLGLWIMNTHQWGFWYVSYSSAGSGTVSPRRLVAPDVLKKQSKCTPRLSKKSSFAWSPAFLAACLCQWGKVFVDRR